MKTTDFHVHLEKTLGTGSDAFTVNANFQAPSGEILVLFGKSGAGKTTILRLLAGLDIPDTGFIHLQGNKIYEAKSGINLSVQQRKVGMVFQESALFPNMTVRQNLEFSLSKGDDKKVIEDLYQIMDIGDLRERKPERLSGGEKKRVELARALASKPELLLLDEPFSALDAALRIRMQDYLLKAHKQYHLTMVLVSHELAEVFRLANRVFEVEKGVIVRQGDPWEIFGQGDASGKFQIEGQIVKIEPLPEAETLTIMVGNQPIKVTLHTSEAEDFIVGQKVMVANKSSDPIVIPINEG